MNHYYTSTGERIKKSVIDARVRKAKAEKLEHQRTAQGYNSCEDCDDSSDMLDCSHDISVDICQKTGKSELAWDVKNITIRCRKHHLEHDNL